MYINKETNEDEEMRREKKNEKMRRNYNTIIVYPDCQDATLCPKYCQMHPEMNM